MREEEREETRVVFYGSEAEAILCNPPQRKSFFLFHLDFLLTESDYPID